MELPPLPPLVGWSYDNPALQQQWRGPSPRSNWLVPGRVLCGDQPYTLDKASGRAGVAGGRHHPTDIGGDSPVAPL
eukprot:COSAG05_NODE_9076_length_649_cov_1.294545_1_plen_75_part_01